MPARWDFDTVAYNGYIYVMGGDSGASSGDCTTGGSFVCNGVFYAPISSNGTMGSWTATTSFSASQSGHRPLEVVLVPLPTTVTYMSWVVMEVPQVAIVQLPALTATASSMPQSTVMAPLAHGQLPRLFRPVARPCPPVQVLVPLPTRAIYMSWAAAPPPLLQTVRLLPITCATAYSMPQSTVMAPLAHGQLPRLFRPSSPAMPARADFGIPLTTGICMF